MRDMIVLKQGQLISIFFLYINNLDTALFYMINKRVQTSCKAKLDHFVFPICAPIGSFFFFSFDS